MNGGRLGDLDGPQLPNEQPMESLVNFRNSFCLRTSALRAAIVALAICAGWPHSARAGTAAADAVIAFDKAGQKLSKPLRIGYVAECAQNTYCQARLKGVKDAAAKFGFEFKLFDANFNPADQLKQIQNATAENFDGYILGPTAAAQACSMWKQFLVPTGKPVVTVDLPMCGDIDYTKGLAATVTMQRQAYFDAHVDKAFSSCTGPCKVAAVGGFVGSDLFNLWETAIKNGVAKHPNVQVVVDQPGNFDPRTTLRVIEDGMRAHPDISVVISPWDDMTRGAEQAITSLGKMPGTDVRIYSVGATKDGIDRVKSGVYNETTALLPYQESYYAAVALVMALQGKPVDAYIDEALLPVITDGPGSIFITKENADKLSPNY
jgi:ABC-type sugar transport system substrate-binding protein